MAMPLGACPRSIKKFNKTLTKFSMWKFLNDILHKRLKFRSRMFISFLQFVYCNSDKVFFLNFLADSQLMVVLCMDKYNTHWLHASHLGLDQTPQKLLGFHRTEDRFWPDFADIKHDNTQEFYWSYSSFISQCPRTGKFRGVWSINRWWVDNRVGLIDSYCQKYLTETGPN